MQKILLQLWKKQWFKYMACAVFGAILTTFIYPTVSRHTEQIEKIKQEYEQKIVEKSNKAQEEKQLLEASYKAEIFSIKKESAYKEEQMSKRINSLVQENSSLKRQTRTTTVEKIFPDGTIERRTISEETLETITQRVAEVKEEAEKKLRETVDKLQNQHEKQLTENKNLYEVKITEISSKLQKTEALLVQEKSKKESLEKNQRKLGIGVGYNSDKLYKVHGHYNFWGPVFLGAHVDTDGSKNNRAALSLGINF